ncbi:MAG: alkyldihydroxyacetonephosphate synthase [Acidimicrobiaceae bacterium]|jgi:alkyldihydroxyacetonephosphate synthase|nr:alkyldihydroxyacetonephosphate synthase [Acidimicrobiaceae bacterium]
MRGQPTPPIGLPDSVRGRFGSAAVVMPDGFDDRLRSACAAVAEGDAEHGRDWWPLAMTWAAGGEVPALPALVARPKAAGEVAAVLRVCSEARVPVTAMAGRSGVCGGSVPAFGGVALDLCGLDGIVGVDDESLLLEVRAGMFGDVLEDSLRADHGVTLGHWPQSMALSTVGGWLACRSAGQFSTRYGKIEDMVVGMEVALADGRLVRLGGRAPRAASGPDLLQLFVGSEGTLGVITEARLRVHPAPAAEQRGAWSFPSFEAGLDACRRVLRRGATPAVLRLYDDRESKRNFDLDDVHALIVLDEGDPSIVEATLAVVAEECRAGHREDDGLVDRWLSHRNDVSGLETAITQGIVVDTCEIAASWSALPRIYAGAIEAVKAVDGAWVVSAHQSHAYTDGACLYFTFAGQREDGDAFYRDVWEAVTRVTLDAGGALSHHHGIGLNRGRFMQAALGDGFDVLVGLKHALDPAGVLNPGKLGLPSPFGPVPWP